jgi:hypothetical protein
VPPRPPGRSKLGQLGAFASAFAAPCFKSKERLLPGAQATNPFGVFDSLILCLRVESGGSRRRATPEERSTDRELEAGRGEGQRRGHLPHRRDPLPQAGNAYTVAPP